LSQNLEHLLKQMHENHLSLRRTIMGLMGSQRALLEQLHEHDLIDENRWERDKIRYTSEYEQLAAKKDEEELREKNELSARQMQSKFGKAMGGQPMTGKMTFHTQASPENTDDDAGPPDRDG
jgi:hypothetical protein